MSNTKPSVEVSPRTVYPAFGRGRRHRVFDATLTVDGMTYKATAKTAAEAKAEVVADAEYVRTAGRLDAGGCSLRAQGRESWIFVLPSGGSMLFDAVNLPAALDRVRQAYVDHDGCRAFFDALADAD